MLTQFLISICGGLTIAFIFMNESPSWNFTFFLLDCFTYLSLAGVAVRQVSFDKTMKVDACRALFQRAHKVLIEALEERAKAELQSQHSPRKRLLLAGAAVAAAPESGSSRSSSSESGMLQTAASAAAIAQESSSARSRSNSQEAQERQEGQVMARHGGKGRSVTFSSTATMVDLTAIDDHLDEGDDGNDDDDDGEIEVIGDTMSGRRGGSGGSPDRRGGGGGGGAAAVKPYQLSGSLLARIIDAGRLMRERDAAGRRCDRQVG